MSIDFKNRQQLLSVLALAVVAFWIGDKVILTPLTKSWADRKAQIASLRKSIQAGSQLAEREASLRDRWDDMQKNTLPKSTSEAASRVLQSFEQWSRDSRISITSVKPQARQTADDYTTVEVRLDGFGSLGTVTRFLYEMEKDPMALKVEAIEMSARDKEGAEIELALQVSGLILGSGEL